MVVMTSVRMLAAAGAAATVIGLAGCASTPPSQAKTHPEDAGTQTVVAEIALERGDCRSASDGYAAAASHGTTALARRASEVGLACENLPAAWQSVERWHATAPDDPNAAVAYGTVALKLYKIPEARGALAPVFKTADPGAQKDLVALIELLGNFAQILSYVRIMALGTASLMMAMVANRMLGAMGSVLVGAVFALLFHVVNFAIGIFSPTVHALRLHYVEFFGRFYSPGGAAYRPLMHWHPSKGS